MTTLAITPNWKNKSAKFKGTVAAGEHVSVTIQNNDGEGGEFIDDASTLRLRVVNPCNGRTLAIFPEPVPEGETPETWDSDLSPLRCTLNLNTVQMLKAVPPAANVPLLWVLDDYDNNTLYFKEQFPVEHWPRLRGEEEPTDLDNYKDIIADFNTRLDGYDTRITGAENAAQAATANASAAAATANQAVGIANQAVDKAETAQNSAAASAEAAHNSALAAEEAQEAAESAAESINSPDATLTEEGIAADAKAAGEAIAAEKERAETAEAAEETRAKGVESGLRTDLTAAQKAIDDEAVLRAAADADLEANKADKATTYTKTEVDAKIAGVQTFQKYLVQTLPDPDEADMKGLYLVPTGETSEEGDLCEEWTVVEEDGEKRWEKIGAKAVDLTLDDTVTSSSANGVKSSGIWSAIWGALSALPTGFASLYDWCVAQFAGKASKSDVDPLLLAQYYPEGNVKSAAEFTQGIKYDDPDTTNRTITVKPFCDTGTAANDNSNLSGRVVIPPFVDAQGNPYISDDGTKFKVVGVSGGSANGGNPNLTTIVAPSTVMTIGDDAFEHCTALTSVSLPAATTVGVQAFYYCTALTSVSLPAATSIGEGAFVDCVALASVSLPAATTVVARAFYYCTALTSVSLPAATTVGIYAFEHCTALTSVSLPDATTIRGGAFAGCGSLASVDFGDTPRLSVPTLGADAFSGVPTSCNLIVPDAQYNDWTAATLPDESANPWYALVTAGYKFLKHSEWEYARKYEVDKKADKPATFTTGNLAALDANGNPTDALIPAANVAQKSNIPYDRIKITTGQLQDHAVQKVTLNAATTTLTLPALTNLSGKVSDFGIDMVNAYAPEVGGTPTPTAASFQLDGTLGADYNLLVPEGEDWSEMTALAAGEMAVYYFTLSAFQINDKLTWEVMKKVVKLVPVPSAP